jgi:rhamnogalacturonyl hydrolase YesR
LPGNDLARNLAYEWIEAYVHDHRPDSVDPRELAVPSSRSRRGALLWDESQGLFQHSPEMIGSTDFFWARGNGWSLVALSRAAEALDAPYTGGRYDQVVASEEIREMLRASAASLLPRRTFDGGWGAYLSKPDQCPVAETSGTALLTYFLALGVNEGWLDREIYAPVVLRALALLLRRVDAEGAVAGIQPPDVGPGCGKVSSSLTTPELNLNYGPGALLLASAEVLKFPEEMLVMETGCRGAAHGECGGVRATAVQPRSAAR